jgi:hypothetical protein
VVLRVEKISGDEELHDFHSSQCIIWVIKTQRMRGVGYVACTGAKRNAYRALVGKPDVERPLGRPRHRSDDNIKMDLKEMGLEGMDWIRLAKDRDRSTR